MRIAERIETVIIGGGQAGLATSYHLGQRGREHVVLEQSDRAGHAWRSGRWDSFTLVTPNWTFQLPGAPYEGNEPNGFMPRDEIVSCFEKYVERFHLPVQFNVEVASVERRPDERGYTIRAGETVWEARNVVVAAGLYQHPKLPPFHKDLPAEVTHVHSGRYRNPGGLPGGAVLVVGSAQSGCQIAEELYRSGRRVYLSVGSAGRVPRRYRGRDVVEWLLLAGFFDRTVEKLPSPEARFAGNPHITGRDGGHTLNLHQFAKDGVVLLGHLRGVRQGKVSVASDLKDGLAKADKFEADVVKMIDGYIQQQGLDAPPETLPAPRDGYDVEGIAEVDLRAAGITSVIWATGYTFDFGMVKLPAFESSGFPIQRGGITEFPGLFFVGLPWLDKQKSGLLLGVSENAERAASSIASAGR